MRKIGFVGLGIMGKPMAKNLIKRGYDLTVYDIMPDAVEALVKEGAKRAASCKEAAKGCDIMITMLPNSPHVKEAVSGENGILAGAKRGLILADMSSISPVAAREIAKDCEKAGVIYLDCPVSGGEPKAVDGTLSIMCGGPEHAFDAVKDILLCMGASAVLVGDVGSGSITKLANQIIVAMNIAAMGEAMALAAKSGVDPKRVFDAIKGGLAGSTVLSAKMPMVLNRSFQPGFRIALHIKDLKNALEAGKAADVPLELTESALKILEELDSQGGGALDHSAMVQHFEKLADAVIQSPKA
jgi:2-hydroxy-3-oxopropionate reductase